MYFQFTDTASCRTLLALAYHPKYSNYFVVVLFFVFVFFTDVFARAWRPMASYIDECIDNEHHLKDMYA